MKFAQFTDSINGKTAAGLLPRALLWLVFLGPFFAVTYSFSNNISEALHIKRALPFAWEHYIPFWDWSILPYWSLNLAYGFSFLGFQRLTDMDRHGMRLVLCQVLAVTIFLLFPLRFSFSQPVLDGFLGHLFALLHSFDKPYNQAPSLHLAMLVLVRARWKATGPAALGLNIWAILVGISTLTTRQHHFIDIATGITLGLFVLWCIPKRGPTLDTVWSGGQKHVGHARRRTAFLMLCGALICLAVCWINLKRGGGGLQLLWVWPSLALAMAAMCYLRLGASGFQKHRGRFSPAARFLFLPWLLFLRLKNSAGRGKVQAVPVAEGLWLGHLPTAASMRNMPPNLCKTCFDALLDCTAEAELPPGRRDFCYHAHPMLGAVPPEVESVAAAVRTLERLRHEGRIVLLCGLPGRPHALLTAAVWLVKQGMCADGKAAQDLLRPLWPETARFPHLADAVSAVLRLPPPAQPKARPLASGRLV